MGGISAGTAVPSHCLAFVYFIQVLGCRLGGFYRPSGHSQGCNPPPLVQKVSCSRRLGGCRREWVSALPGIHFPERIAGEGPSFFKVLTNKGIIPIFYSNFTFFNSSDTQFMTSGVLSPKQSAKTTSAMEMTFTSQISLWLKEFQHKGVQAGRLVSIYKDQHIEIPAKLQSLSVILMSALVTKWTTEIDLGSTGLWQLTWMTTEASNHLTV